MRSLDLFSNVGSHALGFAWEGINTIAFCEINPYRRAVLARHFPEIQIHDDIRTFEGRRAEIVIGGPPCQATSVAAAASGTRTGDTLWPEMLRIVIATRPEWVIVEQPPGNATWEAKVYDGLCRVDYHVARFEFGANDFGAPYIRRRVFVVACPVFSRLAFARIALPREIEAGRRTADARGDWDASKLSAIRVDARSAGELDRGAGSRIRRERVEALGDSNPPHMAAALARAILTATARLC